MKVKIIDRGHELYGHILDGSRSYYDVHHTGNSPDLFSVEVEGLRMQVLSTQVDVEHYDAQLLAKEMARLGAKVGDTVTITKTGSGCYSSGWAKAGSHEITKIDPSGHVEFDGGEGSMFRPEVQVIQPTI